MSKKQYFDKPHTIITTADLWKFVQLERTLHRHISAQVWKFNVDQLPWIQRPMPIPVCTCT